MKKFSFIQSLCQARYVGLAGLLLLVGSSANASTPDGGPPTRRSSGGRAAPQALSIGNRVFQDYNRNGIQDAGEPGIANVPLRLFENGVQRGSTTTDNNGQYAFTDGLKPNTAYEVRLRATDFPSGLTLTKRGQGSDPNADSDARLVGSLAVISVTTGSGTTANDTYDIGLAAGNPDLVLTKTTSTPQVVRGQNASFSIRVDNLGDGPATNVVIRDTLDAGLSYVSSSPAATVSTTPSSQTVLVWNVGTLPASGSATFGLTVRTNTEGVLYNTAYVTTTDTESSTRNNVSRAGVTVPIKLCAGDNFVASLPNQFTNVRWFRNAETTPVATGNSFTITQAGSYSYTSTANTDCPATGCAPIVVENGLVPTLAISPASASICAGGSTSLTATGCGTGTIRWNTNETTASITVSPTSTTAGVYSFTCTPTEYGTCAATASTTVTVNANPVVTLSSTTLCAGGTASLTATAGFNRYVFSAGLTQVGGVSSNTATISIPANSSASTTTYSVTAISTAGCSGTATGTITVNPLPVVALSSATICAGETASLTATAGYSRYIFSSGLTQVGGLSGNTATRITAANSASGTTTYSVTAITTAGCSATAAGSITVNPLPVPSIAVSNGTVCAGESITLTASGGTNYRWNTGATTASISVTATGTYSVTVSNASGCSAISSTSVTVNATPVLSIDSATLCAGQSTTLTVSGCTAGTLVWSTGDRGNGLAVEPLITTTYSATCSLSTGCSSTIASTIVVNPAPTYDTPPVAVAATCAGPVANPDARIDLTTLQNVERADMVVGSSYGNGPAYNPSGNRVVTNGAVSFTGLTNPGAPRTYTIRLFSAGGLCSTDVTVTLQPADCTCPVPKCVPVQIIKVR